MNFFDSCARKGVATFSKFYLVSLFLLFFSSRLSAQNEREINVIPPSPTAASLARYGEVPVSYYTGLPQISIPMYEVKQGNISVPVSLSYHAGGIKVEEMASWVGLGWSLRSGGVITRSVRGLPDESQSFFNPANNISTLLSSTGNTLLNFLRGTENLTEDGESDIYSFSLGDESGSFFYDQSGVIHMLPLSKIQVIKTTAGFQVNDTKGTSYYFENPEYTVVEKTKTQGSVPPLPNIFNISPTAWYLTRIISGDRADTVRFEYEGFITNYDLAPVETKYQIIEYGGSLCNLTNSITRTYNKVYGQRLTRIRFRNGSVKFKANTDREDLLGDKRLDEVEILNADESVFKKYFLYYTYFESINYGCETATYPTNKRLKIDSVVEASGTKRNPPYIMGYDSQNLPCRTSYGRDHWGYYNGVSYNTTLVPSFTYPGPSGPLIYAGADRSVNPYFVGACSLNKMTYPTGGYTNYEFESNTVWNLTTISNPVQNGVYISLAGDPPQAQYTVNFTINISPSSLNNDLGGVIATINAYKTLGDNTVVNAYLEKLDANGNRIDLLNLTQGQQTNYHMGNGTYRLVAQLPLPLSSDLSVYDPFNIAITWQEPGPTSTVGSNIAVGGQRIKKIQDYSADNAPQRTWNFDYNVDNKSTGGMQALLNYTHEMTFLKRENSPLGGQFYLYNCKYIVRQAYTNLPLTQTAGGQIGYEYVKVTETGNGHSIYQFTTPVTNPDELFDEFPYAPPVSFEWQRGLLLKKQDFVEGQTVPVHVTHNVYGTLTSISEFYSGIVAGSDYISDLPNNIPPMYTVYPVISEFEYLQYTYDTLFDRNDHARYIVNATQHEYNPVDLQLASSRVTDSKGQELVTEYKYPSSYANTAMQGTIQTLKQKNMLSNIVSEKVLNGGMLVKGTVNEYNADGNLQQRYLFESSTPVNNPAFDASNVNPLPTYFKSDQSFSYHAASRRISQVTDAGAMATSFLWDYSNTLPVAKAINAPASAIAYTSFEADGRGNWNFTGTVSNVTAYPFPPTGRKYYQLTTSAPLGFTQATIGAQYVVSYWSNSSTPFTITGGTAVQNAYYAGSTVNGWTYHEHKVTATAAQISITGNGPIDEARLYPATAQLITYTYDPLKGMTSQCDQNNNVSYYEYDELGRLKLMRDQGGKIVKVFDYQYKSPVTQ